MMERCVLKYGLLAATLSCAIWLTGCPVDCGEPPNVVAATYMERVNCDELNMCVIDDQMDMVTVEPDPEDANRMFFRSTLREIEGFAFFCGLTANYRIPMDRYEEEGSMTFTQDALSYRRVTSYAGANVTGSCTGTASRAGPPGPPEPVGMCGDGAGGTGGSGGSGGCVPFATDVGGTEAAPVVWEERYTCIDDFGTCIGDENTAVTLELVQNAQRIDWEIAAGVGQESEYSGELCDTSFEWSSQPMTESEDGCWEFTADRFNKRSFGAGFYCIGSGSKGVGSTPEPTPTCEEIAAANVDFTACPLAPPASPIQGDPADCDGTLQVETMSNNVACTAPDVGPCDGCNAYCLGNGFPLGSTEESCGGGFCQCGCTYCRPG